MPGVLGSGPSLWRHSHLSRLERQRVGVSTGRHGGRSSLLVSRWLIQMQTSPEEETEDDKKLPGLRRRAGRSWGVMAALPRVSAPNLRGLWLKKWFIGPGRRGPLSNLSREWDFSSGRGRVNQTSGAGKACKARRWSSVIKLDNGLCWVCGLFEQLVLSWKQKSLYPFILIFSTCVLFSVTTEETFPRTGGKANLEKLLWLSLHATDCADD